MWLDIPKLPKELALYTVWHPKAVRTHRLWPPKQEVRGKLTGKSVMHGKKRYASINEAARETASTVWKVARLARKKLDGWRFV